MHISAALLSAVLLVGATACGGSESSSSNVSSEADGGGSGGTKVAIESPTADSTINTPFTVKVTSSEDLGPSDSGKHHIHLYFDDREDQYEIVEAADWEVPADSPAVEGLEPGEHTMHISLRNADHSAAGSEGETMVTLGEGGGEAPPEDNGSSGGASSGGYDY